MSGEPANTLPPPAVPRDARRRVRALAMLGAILALLAGLVPGRAGALGILWCGGLSVFGSALLAARKRALAALLPALLLLVPAAWLALRDLVPARPPEDILADGTARLESNWDRLRDRLLSALAEPPPAGGDWSWLRERARTLGEGAGLAAIEPATGRAVAWSGWSTPLRAGEREALLPRDGPVPTVLPLRRGLSLRLLAARPLGPRDGPWLVAEVPLPPEPEPGPLARDLPRELAVQVRWEALGEGLRAPFEGAAARPGNGFWALVPLMAGPAHRPVARVSLGLQPVPPGGRARLLPVLVLAGLLLLPWPPPGRPWRPRDRLLAALAVVAGRSLLAAAPPWDPSGPAGIPLSLGATGAAVFLLALLFLPARPLLRLPAGLILAAGGLARVARWTVQTGRSPGEGLLPGPGLPGLLAIAGLAGPVAAGALLLLAGGRRGRGLLVLAVATVVGGGTAAPVHLHALVRAARDRAERELAREVEGRTATWEKDLAETLRLAVGTGAGDGASSLVPERDAIDLWWRSPLGRHGLASGVFRYDAEGNLEDAFASGLPPVVPAPPGEDAPADGRPRREVLRFVGGEVPVRVARVSRPGGGAWAAAVLESPSNLPGLARDDPLRGARVPGARSPFPPAEETVPHLAWFDGDGRLLGADPGILPPAPLAPPSRPRWRTARVSGRPARVLELPEPPGTVSIVLFRPGPLRGAALAAGWAGTLFLLLLAGAILGRLVLAPGATVRAAGKGLRALLTRVRWAVPATLLAAGLLPLLVLGLTVRAAAHRQAADELVAQGARTARFARRFVEDYLAVQGEQAGVLDDAVAAWLARTMGEDLFAWEDGELRATSRPDLVRAGLWPERLPGETWHALAVARRPLLVEPVHLAAGPRVFDLVVVHGPWRAPGDRTGVVSLPLAWAGRRMAAALVEIDRALLVASFLLLALGMALFVPLARRLVRPLGQLQAAAERIGAGDLRTEIPATGWEETRALGRALREMVRRLATHERAEGRRRAFAQMARRVAHEVKNPLTPIGLVVDHLERMAEREDPDLPRALARGLRTIRDQVRVLRETVEEFSDWARLPAARPEPLDLGASLRRWLEPYRLGAPEGVRLVLAGPSAGPEVRADPRLLRRAVVNLVENALAAVIEGSGSRVEIRWGERDGGGAFLEVLDDGPGVPPERREAIFEPDETTRETGTGLGLPIARDAVEAHGGTLAVGDAPGGGARFTIELPPPPA